MAGHSGKGGADAVDHLVEADHAATPFPGTSGALAAPPLAASARWK
jgi:hypothetical protein